MQEYVLHGPPSPQTPLPFALRGLETPSARRCLALSVTNMPETLQTPETPTALYFYKTPKTKREAAVLPPRGGFNKTLTSRANKIVYITEIVIH